jgi:hypothetical protein
MASQGARPFSSIVGSGRRAGQSCPGTNSGLPFLSPHHKSAATTPYPGAPVTRQASSEAELSKGHAGYQLPGFRLPQTVQPEHEPFLGHGQLGVSRVFRGWFLAWSGPASIVRETGLSHMTNRLTEKSARLPGKPYRLPGAGRSFGGA